MKIKTKKEMNLSELIEWAFENNITREWYRANNTEGYISEVFFNFPSGLPKFSNSVDKSDTFTVEVEEEITEDTVLPDSLVVFEHNGNLYTERNKSKCISKILCLDKKVTGSGTKTIYILNEDGTLTLIWKNGKLVE